jgi:hypothetical protein
MANTREFSGPFCRVLFDINRTQKLRHLSDRLGARPNLRRGAIDVVDPAFAYAQARLL